MRTILIYKSDDELTVDAAQKIENIAAKAISLNGRFSIALSGGSTPRKTLGKLVSAKIDWSKIFVFWGDERNVPPNDDKSNFKMANEALLNNIPIPKENVFRWKTELEPQAAAQKYIKKMTEHFGSDLPRFDLILLGVGDDGHTASLFPETEALNETESIAAANWVQTLNEYRFTFTFPIINNSSNVIFIVSGEGKADIAAKVLENKGSDKIYPAEFVKPNDGKMIWMLDRTAAAKLEQI